MKKVLIITYYWPPSGGGGVQRWVKFVKYLREFGWEPVVYVPENPDYPIYDPSMEGEIPEDVTIIRQKIWEPHSIYKRLSGNKDSKIHAGIISEGGKRSWLSEKMIWVRGNFFIPDARMFWIKPSIRFLTKYLKKTPVDAIISTGPPHSMHLIARGVKRKIGIKWLADFRDPWFLDNNAEDMKYSQKTIKKHQKLELSVLQEADKVVVVSYTVAEDYQKLSGRNIEIITNGFDASDFVFKQKLGKNKDKFTIGHYGTMGKYRNPKTFFRVLRDLSHENSEFEKSLAIELAGTIDDAILSSIEKYELTPKLNLLGYISHNESIIRIKEASILLLPLDKNPTMKGRIPGKIFEYLATQNPILGFGHPVADCSKILNETKTGKLFDYDDYDSIKKFILEAFTNSKRENNGVNHMEIEKYTRKNLTHSLSQLLDNIPHVQH